MCDVMPRFVSFGGERRGQRSRELEWQLLDLNLNDLFREVGFIIRESRRNVIKLVEWTGWFYRRRGSSWHRQRCGNFSYRASVVIRTGFHDVMTDWSQEPMLNSLFLKTLRFYDFRSWHCVDNLDWLHLKGVHSRRNYSPKAIILHTLI